MRPRTRKLFFVARVLPPTEVRRVTVLHAPGRSLPLKPKVASSMQGISTGTRAASIVQDVTKTLDMHQWLISLANQPVLNALMAA